MKAIYRTLRKTVRLIVKLIMLIVPFYIVTTLTATHYVPYFMGWLYSTAFKGVQPKAISLPMLVGMWIIPSLVYIASLFTLILWAFVRYVRWMLRIVDKLVTRFFTGCGHTACGFARMSKKLYKRNGETLEKEQS